MTRVVVEEVVEELWRMERVGRRVRMRGNMVVVVFVVVWLWRKGVVGGGINRLILGGWMGSECFCLRGSEWRSDRARE